MAAPPQGKSLNRPARPPRQAWLLAGLIVLGLVAGGGRWLLAPDDRVYPPVPSPPANPVTPSAAAIPVDLATIPDRDSVAALADDIGRALRSGSAAERDHAFTVLLPRLLLLDANAATTLALGWEPGALREELLRQLITRWAALDLGRALDWLTGLRDQVDRQNAARSVTDQVGQSDPVGAMELAELLRVGLDDGSLDHYAQLWTEEDPAAGVDWIVHRPPGALRDRLIARIAWVRAQRDPVEAAQLTLDHIPAGPTRDAALAGVVRQWAVRDLAAAENWVAQFPAGPTRDLAAQELATVRKLR